MIRLKKLMALVLALLFVAQQTMFMPVLASEISGIDGVDINGGANQQFDINAQFVNGNTGFRHYGQFDLSQGDIANLIYKIGMKNFVNLVDSQININGIVNTMKDNNFFNGHAIFVSPMGMVVGASGVLNVGSLTAIAPNPVDYLKYTGYNAAKGGADYVLSEAAKNLDMDLSNITIPGISDDVNFKLLKEADQTGDIKILGKILARDNVELIGKNIKIGDKDNRAEILAGVANSQVPDLNKKIETVEQAGRLFKALVNNNITNGAGFGTDANGNIVIKAQSIKMAELMLPSTKLVVAGKDFAVDQLFNIVEDKYVPKTQEELDKLGLNVSVNDVNAALKLALKAYQPTDATQESVVDGQTLASVNIENALLGAKNIDINAVSKVDYFAQKGSSFFDKINGEVLKSITDELGLSDKTEEHLNNIIAGTNFTDFEGARAKAEINIGKGADLFATDDVSVKSLAYANTAMKLTSLRRPATDTTSELFYLMGTRTISNVNVLDGATITAGRDANIVAASRNNLNVKIQNPTAKDDLLLGAVVAAPSVQVSVLKTENYADTKANVQNGATIKAGNNVNVNALNVTEDLGTLSSIATINKEGDPKPNTGIAVAVVLRDSTVNTEANVDGNVTATENMNVIAQSVHTELTKAQASVEQVGFFGAGLKGLIANKVMDVIASKVSGLADVLDTVFAAANKLPSSSASVLVNNSNLNTTAKIGPNANITAKNVNVTANALDLVINNATTKLDTPKTTQSSDASKYVPEPGVAVLVNNQNNNTNATIDGATVNASGDVKVNATLEQPMNETDFELALNLIQTGVDIGDVPSDVKNGTQEYGFDNPDWDFRLLMQSLMNTTDEIMFDVKNVMFGIKNSGLSSNLGLQGFFNNWAQSTASNPNGIGVAASVVVSDVLNNTVAEIVNTTKTENSIVNANNIIVNAANKVVQFNAAGDVGKLWKLTSGASGASGVGGTVMVEGVNSNAIARIGDKTELTTKKDINVNSANEQNFLTLVVTGSNSASTKGAALSGSTVIQDVKGKTESSVGKSKIKAKNLTVQAGKAKIATVPKTLENVFIDGDPFANLDENKYEVGLEEDLSAGNIKRFHDAEINLGIDEKLYPNGDGMTDTGTIVGSAVVELNPETEITDRLSNLIVTGAIASQKQADATAGTGSSGVAAGASVNVSEFGKEVNALIKEGADITVDENLNVLADSKSQSLNLAIAGAFAGGISMKKPSITDKIKNKADGYLTKLKGVLGNVEEAAKGIANSKIADATGSTVKNELTKGDSVNADGTKVNGATTDALGSVSGNKADADGNKPADLGSNLVNAPKVADTEDFATASKNLSAALAGSVNTQINNSKVTASVSGANIKVGKDVNVEANQITRSLNIGGGLAKAATVGAGAAVNFVQNTNETNALIQGSNISFKGAQNKLNVKATENNDNIHVGIGVGAAKGDVNGSKTQAALGGSFNTDILKNKVTAGIDSSNISNENAATNSIDVSVDAENHSTSYKGAGGASINIGSAGTTKNAVGAGMSANINVINKTTGANIKDSKINNAKNVEVVANKAVDADGNLIKTEDLIGVGVAGNVVTGASNSFTFQGAIGADVINNNVSAVIDNSVIKATNDVDVIANNKMSSQNIAGALGFSTSNKGAGIGLGTIVNVVTSTLESAIKNNSEISTKGSVDVLANNNEVLRFLAINMGIAAGGGSTPVAVNAIVNVLNNDMLASIANSKILNSSGVKVNADYDTTITGITNADSIAISKGNAAGGNTVVDVLSSEVKANVKDATIVAKKDTNSTGEVSVKATSDAYLDITPLGVAISSGGPVAAAANVAVNVIGNTTSAIIDGSNLNVGLLDVLAEDNTISYSRGGTIGVSLSKAGIAGTILLEILSKDIDAKINNSVVTSDGNVAVNAKATNAFGPKDTTSITLDGILNSLETTDLEDIVSLLEWQMLADIAGGGKAGVSGSLVAKVSQNDVDAAIANSIIKSNDLKVAALNEIYTRNIVGNISVGGTAAVGGSLFVNVNLGNTNAIISDSEIAAKGDVTVDAQSIQDFKTIMVVGGAAGTAAVNGSANSNTAKDSTIAKIQDTDITESKSVTVKAKAKDDVESINLAAQGAGTVSVGGIAYNNNFLNKVHAIITGQKSKGIVSNGDVIVDAKSSESYSANAAMIGGGGSAAINGVAIANIANADIKAQIGDKPVADENGVTPEAKKTTVISNNGKVDVKANHNFNQEKYGDKTNLLTAFMGSNGDKSITMDSFKDFLPTVTVVSISGAGVAAVTGSAIVDVINTDTVASVANAVVKTLNGLNVEATTNEVLYNATAGVAASGNVSIGGTTVTNVLKGHTIAEVIGSTIEDGDVNVKAEQNTNLNSILFMASAAGEGASATGVVGVNTIINDTSAIIDSSEIKNAENVTVTANSNVQTNNVGVAASGVGIGAAINGLTITNVSVGNTKAGIQNNTKIAKGNTKVNAKADTSLYNLIAGGTFSAMGADVGAYAPVNVLTNNVDAYIIDSVLSNNGADSEVTAKSIANLETLVGVAGVSGVGASIGATGLVNVIDNDINAYVKNTNSTNGKIAISASQTSDMSGLIAAVNGGGLSVAGNANVVTNTLGGRINAYTDNLTAKNTALTVDTSSTENVDYVVAAMAGGGIAGVTAAAVVNTVNNRLAAEVKNSNLTGGSIDVNSNKTTTLKNNFSGVTIGGGAIGGGTIVNVMSSDNKAGINNTQGSDLDHVTVSANSVENITSDTYMSGIGAFGAGAVSANVNVLEGSTNAYINSGSKTLKTKGALKVTAKDDLNLDVIAGSVAGGGLAASGSVNTNVINNAVVADVYGDGNIEANTVDVEAHSDIDYSVGSTAVGGGAVASTTTVAVTTIGNRFKNSSDMNFGKSEANVSDKVSLAQNTANQSGESIILVQNEDGSYVTTDDANAQGATKYNKPNVSLTATDYTANEGTVARIATNVTSNNGVNVKATNHTENIVKSMNVTGAVYGAGSSVSVTNTTYNTRAAIDSGKVVAKNGNVDVKAKNDTTLDRKHLSASAGFGIINVGVDYVKNNAITQAITGNLAQIDAGSKDVNVIATSKDIINTKATSVGLSAIDGGISVALSETNNTTRAKVGSGVKANNLNVEAVNSSQLTSSAISGKAALISANASVNKARANAITEAIVDATGNNIALANDLNVKSATTDLNVINNVIVGSASYVDASLSQYGAIVDSQFNSMVNGGNITAKNANIKAGLRATENSNGTYTVTDSAANINAEVKSESLKASVYKGAITTLYASASGNAKAGGNGGTITANNINISSKLNKKATSTSKELSVSGVEVGAINLETKVAGTTEIDTNYSTLIADKVDMDVVANSNATTKAVSGSISLISGSGSSSKATVIDNAKIKSGNINATDIDMDIDSNKTAKLENSSAKLNLFNVGSTNMESYVGGTTGVRTFGTIKNKADNGNASSLNINIDDTSKAFNEASSAELGFIRGSVLNISSTIASKIDSDLDGYIYANDIDLNSTLNREVTANATSRGGGIANLDVMHLNSIIKNGANTLISGRIRSNTFDVNSKMINRTNSFVQESKAGLVALAHGVTKNNVEDSAVNDVKFSSADVETNKLNAVADSDSQSYMHKTSTSNGFIVIKGGKVQNKLNGTSQIDVTNGSKIKTVGENSETNFNVKNRASTPQEMVFTDDAGGFIAKGGAQLDNSLSQSAKLNINGGSKIDAAGDLVLSVDNGTKFKQKTFADGSGFTAHNEASSVVSATINNEININGYGTDVVGKNVNVNMNSSNELSSIATAEAHHFAGSPSAYSKVNLNVNNNLNVLDYGKLRAYDSDPKGTKVSINFMDQSTQNIYQKADLFVRAAVATGNTGGGIDFATNNKVNIAQNSEVTSSKDVFINFNRGVENLDSNLHSKKISHLAFGIPITKEDSWQSSSSSSSNKVIVDGKIKAGAGSQMKLTIDEKGIVEESSLQEGKDYIKTEEDRIEGAPAGSEKAKAEEAKLSERIAELNAQLEQLQNDKNANQEEINELNEQIQSLKMQIVMINYLDTKVADADKITNAEFKAVIKKVLDDNNIANSEAVTEQLLNIMTSEEGQKLFVDAKNNDLVFIYQRDEKGKIITDAKGNPKFVLSEINADGTKSQVEYQFKYNGNEIAKKGDNFIIVGSDKSELQVKEYTYDNLVSGLDSKLDSSSLTSDLNGLGKNATDEQILEVLNNHYVLDAADKVADVKQAITDKKVGDCVASMDIDNTQVQSAVSTELDSINSKVGQVTKEIDGQKITFNTYDGDILYDNLSKEAKDDLNNAYEQAEANLNNFSKIIMGELNKNMADANTKLADLNAKLDYIQNHGIDDVLVKNGAFLFNDLNATGGRISINAQKGTSEVSGSGEMRVSVADILINNHSKYDLIFKDLFVGKGATGVTVDGKNYAGSASGIKQFESNLRVFTDGTAGNLGCITINNYFDPNRPLINSDNGSNIIFNGEITTNAGDVKIYNEGGNIELNDTITAKKVTVDMPQGSFKQNTRGKKYQLNKGDTLFAGKTIDITASKFEIGGTMQAGVADKNIVITDEMLNPNNLIVDEQTGLKNMINLDQGNKSVYMNGTNNIKAIYDEKSNTVQLFGVQITDNAAINLNATTDANDTIYITSDAALKHADGYGKITIENKTNANLDVGNLKNNKIAGGVHYSVNGVERKLPAGGTYQDGTYIEWEWKEVPIVLGFTRKKLVPVEKPLYKENGNYGTITNLADGNGETAITKVITEGSGDLNLYGKVSSGVINDGKNQVDILTNGNLNVKTHNGYTLDTNGNVTLTKNGANGGINIDGLMKTTNGDFLLTNNGNNGTTITKNGSVENSIGNVKIDNKVGKLTVGGFVLGNVQGDVLVNSQAGIDVLEGAIISATDGALNITNETSGINIAGNVNHQAGNVQITNKGAEGTKIASTGKVENAYGDINVDNKQGNLTVNGSVISKDDKLGGNNIKLTTETGKLSISGNVDNQHKGNIDIIAKGSDGLEVINNAVVSNNDGKITLTNSNKGITVGENAEIKNNSTTVDDNLTITNNGTGLIDILGKVTNKVGNLFVNANNAASGVNVAGKLANEKGNLTVKNIGSRGTTVSGEVSNVDGNLTVENTNGGILVDATADKKGLISNKSNNAGDKTLISNTGDKGITVKGDIKNEGKSTLLVDNKNTVSGIEVAEGALIQGNSTANGENMTIKNDGSKGILIAGVINNIKGETSILNNNVENISSIKVATTGLIKNDNGNLNITNKGTNNNATDIVGIDVEGLISAAGKDVNINNENSNIEIGEYASSNDSYISGGNVNINQNNGSILNGIVDATKDKHQNHDLGNKDQAYKTLISATKDLNMNVQKGNIGTDTHALANKESGFGINASTRDYTESINVNVKGNVKAEATNNNDALINLRAKDSSLNIDKIKSDGNVMLTAADWKQPDMTVAPSDPNYFKGYSINNKSKDGSANIVGKNISMISSDNIGSKGKEVTYEQLPNGSVSALAENNIHIKGVGKNNNVWQVITKRGNIGLDFTGDAVIREITAGKDLKIVSKAANLTIYDLGKTPNVDFKDDILYPHDRIELEGGGVVPEKVEISVLDTNPDTRVNPDKANSTLNIFNAYVKGRKDGTPDVKLKADNIIAHSYDSASSIVSNKKRPAGFDAKDGRTYANDYMDPTAEKNLKAKGFNTYGEGSELIFDVQGVTPDVVKAEGENVKSRDYHSQEAKKTLDIFNNPVGFKETVYKANDVTLSLNSSEVSPKDNRGMILDKFYVDNAYVDTKDLNLKANDAFVTNYAEFRNGNLGGSPGAHSISPDYRWITIVDNDYHRNIHNSYGIPVTSQLYTKLTGSFGLKMGDLIALQTKAPVVVYNPYETIVQPRTENSFYRLTYKDDKIQKTTTTHEFDDIDKSTYKPTKREFLRFSIMDTKDGFVKISDRKQVKNPRIIAIEDISRGGIKVVHDGSLKKGEKFIISLECQGVSAAPEVEVMRVVGDRAGLKFVNMNRALSNKILYMNMFITEQSGKHVSQL